MRNASLIRGFSIVEMLVALVILVFGIATMAALFASGVLAMQKAHNIQLATDAAQERIEQMRRVSLSSLNSTNFPPTFTISDPDTGEPVGSGTLTITPQETGSSPPIEQWFLVEVTTRVGFTKATQGSVRLVTYITPR